MAQGEQEPTVIEYEQVEQSKVKRKRRSTARMEIVTTEQEKFTFHTGKASVFMLDRLMDLYDV